MEIDAPHHSSPDQQHGSTQLLQQLDTTHLCDHRCHVELMFGNLYRCRTSGQVHCCDATCQQRLPQDRYSTICRISKKVFHHEAVHQDASRKRGACSGAARSQCKRGHSGADQMLADDRPADAMVV